MNRRRLKAKGAVIIEPIQKTSLSWKDHPIIVASGASAATLLLCLAVFREAVLPMRTAQIEIESLRLKEALGRLQNEVAAQSGRNAELERNLEVRKTHEEALQGEIEALQGELLEVKVQNLFTSGTPYPNGLGLVRIGMSARDMAKVFKPAQISSDADSPEIVTVTLENSPFERVLYFFDGVGGKITHIGFNLPILNKYPKDFLQRKLIDAFGAPTTTKKAHFFYWKAGPRIKVFKSDEYSILVMGDGYMPGYWPE